MNRINNQKGFTLIELVVSAFVFSIIVAVVSGLFVQILKAERRAFAAQKIQENGLFIVELMSREIRVSQIVANDQSPAGNSPSCTLQALTIRHPVNGTVTYALVGDILQRTADGSVTDLSSSAVSFSRLNFCLTGGAPTDAQQARVGIIASIQNKTGKEIVKVNLETSVSSRDVQTEF
ncbi:MAG: prepilin-type N-terminal cleavage/methylation domain-containing protein [Candidatus Pacebacteria bacterium]|nr:prepilin-type N-terminal cleavage/methylation domain-containing protein [Candidatus Paceibacterota bacterium]